MREGEKVGRRGAQRSAGKRPDWVDCGWGVLVEQLRSRLFMVDSFAEQSMNRYPSLLDSQYRLLSRHLRWLIIFQLVTFPTSKSEMHTICPDCWHLTTLSFHANWPHVICTT